MTLPLQSVIVAAEKLQRQHILPMKASLRCPNPLILARMEMQAYFWSNSSYILAG